MWDVVEVVGCVDDLVLIECLVLVLHYSGLVLLGIYRVITMLVVCCLVASCCVFRCLLV
jgi:hypothetical protein